MGTKRPFDEELQEFIKHPKHGDYSSKPDLFEENRLTPEKSQNIGVAGEGDDPKSTNFFTVPDMVCKGFETGAPLPLVTDDDGGAHGSVFCSDLFPEFFEFNEPRRHLFRFDETGLSFLYCFPRKEVPIGPDHQADVPEFDSETARNHRVDHDKFVGVCIVPMSESDCLTGESQTVCNCFDGGSVRCVRQHVGEARWKLKRSLGDRKFVDLGFSEMGEEAVAAGWSEEEERVFHEVVYRNPASVGRKFWEGLSAAFPARTKKELVSYYFNVFVLRRRAAQNRSGFLEADSDDDEWWGNDGGGGGGGSSDNESSEDGGGSVDGAAAGESDACKTVDESSAAANGGLQPCSAANGGRQPCSATDGGRQPSAGEWFVLPRDVKDD